MAAQSQKIASEAEKSTTTTAHSNKHTHNTHTHPSVYPSYGVDILYFIIFIVFYVCRAFMPNGFSFCPTFCCCCRHSHCSRHHRNLSRNCFSFCARECVCVCLRARLFAQLFRHFTFDSLTSFALLFASCSISFHTTELYFELHAYFIHTHKSKS